MELGLVTSGDALKSVDELLPQLIEARIGSGDPDRLRRDLIDLG